jgi:hypothetical protein
MEFLGLQYPSIEMVSREPPSSEGSKKHLKHIDSDSPDDEESESIITISIA